MNFAKALVLCALSLFATQAHASNLADNKSLCAAINCAATPIRGSVLVDPDPGHTPDTLPWVGQIFVRLNDCLRIETVSQTADLRLTLVAPNGTVWSDDDGGACNLCSLIKVRGTQIEGWWTLQVAQFAGAPETSRFEILYGRYKVTNQNCQNPTQPLIAPSPTSKTGAEEQ